MAHSHNSMSVPFFITYIHVLQLSLPSSTWLFMLICIFLTYINDTLFLNNHIFIESSISVFWCLSKTHAIKSSQVYFPSKLPEKSHVVFSFPCPICPFCCYYSFRALKHPVNLCKNEFFPIFSIIQGLNLERRDWEAPKISTRTKGKGDIVHNLNGLCSSCLSLIFRCGIQAKLVFQSPQMIPMLINLHQG